MKWIQAAGAIAKGTYWRVYSAVNITNGELVSVKQIELPKDASNADILKYQAVVKAFRAEIKVLNTLKPLIHPNIVRYLEDQETPHLSIFMENLPDISIRAMVHQHGKFKEEVVKAFTTQIIDGLHYLHSKDIIHGDLKTKNVLIGRSGICKLANYASFKDIDERGELVFTTNMPGSVYWMAPEVIKASKDELNSKIDIWSLGCIVLEMWSGARPWPNEDVMSVMTKLHESASSPPIPETLHLSPPAENFRSKCFEIDPEKRETAKGLSEHPYLNLPESWSFDGHYI